MYENAEMMRQRLVEQFRGKHVRPICQITLPIRQFTADKWAYPYDQSSLFSPDNAVNRAFY